MLKLIFTVCAFMFVAQLPACELKDTQEEIVQDALSCGKRKNRHKQKESTEEAGEKTTLSCGKHKKRQKDSSEEVELFACRKCRR